MHMNWKVIQPIFALLLALGLSNVTHAAAVDTSPAMEKATFAGGCFWCMESPFRNLAGVSSVRSGYTGGRTVNPSYREVSAGDTGHAEAVQVVFDPSTVTYAQLLEVFWRNVDPTVKDQQFCDIGPQYRSAIFVHGASQRAAAEASLGALQKSNLFKGQTLYTEIVDAGVFYEAEDYHQDYAAKNPSRYKFYRWNCGRDARLEKVWGAAPAH